MMRRFNHLARILVSILVLGLCVVPARGQETETKWRTIEEHWYTMEIIGARAGWVSAITQTNGAQFRTMNETSMKLNRGNVSIEINIASTFVETADGKPVTAQSTQMMSKQVMESSWEFMDGKVKITTTQGGRDIVSEQTLGGEWFPPHAASEYAKKQRQAGEEVIVMRLLQPESGANIITTTSKRTGTGKFEYDGQSSDVTIWSTTNDLIAVESIEHIDGEGTMVYQETLMPGLGKVVTRRSNKTDAQGGGGGEVPELLVQTVIKPQKPIENSMKATSAKLRLTPKTGKLPALASAGAQRVEMSEDGTSAVLTIDINDNVAASAEDAANKNYLAATSMIDSEDELIQKLARRATARSENEEEMAGDDPMKRAEALRRFARKHISKKGMETAFASASETAKMRAGDCSEHGVFLAALLRADGIPARVATGLVYVDEFAGHEGIFGWHMWTQALIDGKWVDFDATLPRRYNAAHVLASTSSLGEGSLAVDMGAVIQLIGNLNIEVIEVGYE